MSGAGLASPRQERFAGGGEGIYGQAEGDRGDMGEGKGIDMGMKKGIVAKTYIKLAIMKYFV